MLDEIIDGITEALHEGFGDEYPIYTDDVEQGLTEPCFTVRFIRPAQNQFLGLRYYSKNPVCVTYFPKERDQSAEKHAVIEKLFSILEYVTVGGDLVRGTNMDAHIEDGVVVFAVDYNFFVRKQPIEETKMDELETREKVNA